jgi:lipopolysaccharide export system permease protein
MLLVQKMYLKEFLRVIVVLALGMSCVISMLSLIDKVDDLLPHRPAVTQLIEYAALQVPRFLHYLLPMAILLSSLFVCAQAIKRREIVAIKTAGGKMKRIMKPFLGFGIVLTLTGFVVSEALIPQAAQRLAVLKEEITKKKSGIVFRGGTLYVRGRDGSVVRVSLYMPDTRRAQGVSIFTFDSEGLQQRIDADSATWEGEQWRLMGVKVLRLSEGTTAEMAEMPYGGIESEEIFREELWKSESMSLGDLIKYQERLKEAGYKNERIDVDIGSRLSYPFVNLFMLMLGIALSLGEAPHRVLRIREGTGSRAQGALITAGLGLVISLVYWFGYSFFLSLGYAGILPAIAAPWIVPAAFCLLSVWLYRQIPE